MPPFQIGKDNKTPQFLALNPLGKVPVLVTPSGPLFESKAIARYVARLRPEAGLYGHGFYQAAQVDQWIDFSANEFEPARGVWQRAVGPDAQPQHSNPKVVSEAKKDVEAALSVLDAHLLHATFLVGQSVTLADLVVFAALFEPFSKIFPPEYQTKFPNVVRWYTTIAHQPQVVAVVGEATFATQEAQVKVTGKGGKEGKAAGGEKKEAGAAAPKEAAAKPAPKPKPDADDEDEDEKPRERVKNALDDLPPTPMVLDTVKKLAFSVRPILPDFFEQLWPQFDAAGYTWFTLRYKFNDENKIYFKVGNLVGGFIQRSDAARRYSMGVLNVYGNPDEETAPWKVSGAWLFRGPAIIREMIEENPDQEYYDWVKQDVSTAEGKAAVKEQFFAETLEGQPVLDRRFFK